MATPGTLVTTFPGTVKSWQEPADGDSLIQLDSLSRKDTGRGLYSCTPDPDGFILVCLPKTPVSYVAIAKTCYRHLPAGTKLRIRPNPFAVRGWQLQMQACGKYLTKFPWEESKGTLWEALQGCKAVVVSTSDDGIAALMAGLPVACLEKTSWSDSPAVLDCSGDPEYLAELPNTPFNRIETDKLLCAIVRTQVVPDTPEPTVVAPPPPPAVQAVISTPSVDRVQKSALVWVLFGEANVPRRRAEMQGIMSTLQSLKPRPAVFVLVDATPEGVGIILKDPDLLYLRVPVTPESKGLWLKGPLQNLATKLLTGLPIVQHAVFLDADCVPENPAWMVDIETMLSRGVNICQPWDLCVDTKDPAVGGASLMKGRALNDPSCWQPGYSWAVRLDWLQKVGGMPASCIMGGEDAVMVTGWFPPHEIFSRTEADWFPQLLNVPDALKQPPVYIPGTLSHINHGGVEGRQYALRYTTLFTCVPKVTDVVSCNSLGLPVYLPTVEGKAWKRMVARRAEWKPELESIRGMWQECLTTEQKGI